MRTEAAKAAAMIRKEMKANGIKGAVRSSNYAGGSSVRISITNELPATKAALELFASKFKMGHFDGMTDMYEYSNTNADLPQVSFVFVKNDISDEVMQEAWDLTRTCMEGFEDAPESHKEAWSFTSKIGDGGSDFLRQTLSDNDPLSFWFNRKPRITA
jgi:hypothetical protein